jgi:putative two-component system response regulator
MLQFSLEELGYEATAVRNGLEAIECVRTGLYQLVVSDWEMPEMTGIDLCRSIRERQMGSYVYIILLTSRSGTANVVEGFDAGADDFITKPFQPDELAVRLKVGERILSLESRDVTIFALAKLAECRDPETGLHLERMREYCRVLADELSTWGEYHEQADGDFVQMIYLTSPLHDIGKVGIPDSVLLKPGRLDENEFEMMKQHTVIGGQTLDTAAGCHPEAGYLRMARDIAWTHHERVDGSGYPNGLEGAEIPLCGRIAALADVYDALTTKRVYKPAYSHDTAKSMILDGKGSHFDPDIVQAFLNREDEFIDVNVRLNASEGPVRHQRHAFAGTSLVSHGPKTPVAMSTT